MAEPKTLTAAYGCEEEILQSLRRIIRAVDLQSRKLIVEHGLSGPQLACLRQLERQGQMPTGTLAEALQLSGATVSGILDRLEARGYVERRRHADDKRRVLVRLSRMGRAALQATPATFQDGFLARLRALSPRQQAEIQRALTRVLMLMALDDAPAGTASSWNATRRPKGPRGKRGHVQQAARLTGRRGSG